MAYELLLLYRSLRYPLILVVFTTKIAVSNDRKSFKNQPIGGEKVNIRKRLVSLTVLLLLGGFASAAELVNVAGATNVALNGYDTVAFFSDSKPVFGNFKITSTYKGATYFFASTDHKKMFDAAPSKYAPQFGGYCAFAVANGGLAPVDVNTWKIENGKLYLNFSPEIAKIFEKDMPSMISKAEKNWPVLVEAKGK